MKQLIALAAVLSSAALTIPTVTDVGDRKAADATQMAALAASDTDDNG